MLRQLEDTLELYLVDRAPVSIPSEWKEIIVQFAPWFLIVSTLISAKSALNYFGIGSLVSNFGYLPGIQTGLSNLVDVAIWVVLTILQGMAILPSFKREEKAWRFVYYTGLVNSLRSLLVFDLIGFVIQTLAFFYVLFQVKDYYTSRN